VGKRWVARVNHRRYWAFVSFSGKRAGTQKVRMVLRLKGGRKVVDVRRYKTCAAKGKKR
jgi:hypothetical protein